MSLNTAQIIGEAKKVWGRDISDQEAGMIMNAAQGGDAGAVNNYLKNDVTYLSDKAKTDRQAAIAPAIDSYNQTKPEIQNLYATERTRLEGDKQPLQDRYKVLLDSIKGNQTTEENRQTLTTNNELGRRGISSDSGLYQQQMTDTLNPITSKYANLTKETSLAQEGGLKGISDAIAALVPKESQDLRSITQAIADLQANTGNQSVTDFLNLTQQGFQNNLQTRQLEETSKQNSITNALAELQAKQQTSNPYATLSEGQTLYDLVNRQPVYTANKTYKATAGAVGGGGW